MKTVHTKRSRQQSPALFGTAKTRALPLKEGTLGMSPTDNLENIALFSSSQKKTALLFSPRVTSFTACACHQPIKKCRSMALPRMLPMPKNNQLKLQNNQQWRVGGARPANHTNHHTSCTTSNKNATTCALTFVSTTIGNSTGVS